MDVLNADLCTSICFAFGKQAAIREYTKSCGGENPIGKLHCNIITQIELYFDEGKVRMQDLETISLVLFVRNGDKGEWSNLVIKNSTGSIVDPLYKWNIVASTLDENKYVTCVHIRLTVHGTAAKVKGYKSEKVGILEIWMGNIQLYGSNPFVYIPRKGCRSNGAKLGRPSKKDSQKMTRLRDEGIGVEERDAKEKKIDYDEMNIEPKEFYSIGTENYVNKETPKDSDDLNCEMVEDWFKIDKEDQFINQNPSLYNLQVVEPEVTENSKYEVLDDEFLKLLDTI